MIFFYKFQGVHFIHNIKLFIITTRNVFFYNLYENKYNENVSAIQCGHKNAVKKSFLRLHWLFHNYIAHVRKNKQQATKMKKITTEKPKKKLFRACITSCAYGGKPQIYTKHLQHHIHIQFTVMLRCSMHNMCISLYVKEIRNIFTKYKKLSRGAGSLRWLHFLLVCFFDFSLIFRFCSKLYFEHIHLTMQCRGMLAMLWVYAIFSFYECECTVQRMGNKTSKTVNSSLHWIYMHWKSVPN